MAVKRKGVIHTIESILAAIIFLMLIITLSQQVDVGGEIGPDIKIRERNALETLDLSGELRPPAENQSVSILRDRLDDHLNALNVEAALLHVNTTQDTVSFSGTHTETFTVNNSAVERQVLHLWFEGTEAPNASINGNPVYQNTGTVDGYEKVDISDETVDGDNTLEIETAAASKVSYSVDIYEYRTTGEPPSDTDVISASYPISGYNVSFAPVEVSVQAWQ
ncbi:MAG: hypothetical protein MUP63_01975 [Candidatus Nanohaloarchaeota archaeon QJJ-7]|nr:hypothetical protein [Candidatus Nanohaloarchaeota archaeon QJJ-7]